MWKHRFLLLARHVSGWSKDPSTNVGAVIVDDRNICIGLGYNGFPRGIEDSEERLNNRPIKYKYSVHAEINAVLNSNQSVQGCTIYTTLFPCENCAKLLIQAGIKKVVAIGVFGDLFYRWKESFKISKQMFDEAGIPYEEVDI